MIPRPASPPPVRGRTEASPARRIPAAAGQNPPPAAAPFVNAGIVSYTTGESRGVAYDDRGMRNTPTTRYRIVTASGEVHASCRTMADAEAAMAVYASQGYTGLTIVTAETATDNRW